MDRTRHSLLGSSYLCGTCRCLVGGELDGQDLRGTLIILHPEQHSTRGAVWDTRVRDGRKRGRGKRREPESKPWSLGGSAVFRDTADWLPEKQVLWGVGSVGRLTATRILGLDRCVCMRVLWDAVARLHCWCDAADEELLGGCHGQSCGRDSESWLTNIK